MSHRFSGHCPVCQRDAEFASHSDWYRDHLLCGNCGSIPRERAFAWVLDTRCGGWQDMVVHESSPADRLVSTRMRDACAGYIGSQFFPGIPAGEMHNGYRCENLEQMTFADGSIDLHCHLDVLEHVNHPDRCFAEMERTLKPGGHMVFTTPVYEGQLATERTVVLSTHILPEVAQICAKVVIINGGRVAMEERRITVTRSSLATSSAPAQAPRVMMNMISASYLAKKAAIRSATVRPTPNSRTLRKRGSPIWPRALKKQAKIIPTSIR